MRIPKFFWLVLVSGIFLLSGCATLDKLPAEGSIEPACPAVYSVPGAFLSSEGWADHNVEIIGYTKDPFRVKIRENGEVRYVDSPRDCQTVIPGSCFRDYEEVKACMEDRVTALYLTPDDMPGEGVPSTNPSSGGAATSSSNSASNPLVNIPQVTKYYWEQPNGFRTEFSDEQSAMAALNNSTTGGKVIRTIELPSLNGGLPTVLAQFEISSLQACTLPAGISFVNPTTPYYKDSFSGEYNVDVNAAMVKAEQRSEASNILIYTRCVEGGVVASVPQFVPPQGLQVGPTTPYYGVKVPGVDSWMFQPGFSENRDLVFTGVTKSASGGTIQQFVRGKPIGDSYFIPSWYPPLDWCSSSGTLDCNNPPDVTIPVWYSVPLNTYYGSKDLAVVATEKFIVPTMPRYYPGGDVVLMSRGVPKTPEAENEYPIKVSDWQLPGALPDGWDASAEYASYNEVVYVSKKDAINESNANWWRWYLTAPKQKMSLFRRGVLVQEDAPPARFLLPLAGLLLLWILLSLLFRLVSLYRRAMSGNDPDASALMLTLLKLFAALKTVIVFIVLGSVFLYIAMLAIRELRNDNLLGFSLWGFGLVIVVLFSASLNGSRKFIHSLKKRNHK